MTSHKSDRQLTEKEWEVVEKQINEAQERHAMRELGEMLIAQKQLILQQSEEILDHKIYIKLLEDTATRRQDKLDKLEKTLELLETELARLR